MGLGGSDLARVVYSHVMAKVERGVEDFPIEFEDGEGNGPDAEESQGGSFLQILQSRRR